jgi:hypothetical protein
MHSPVCFAGNVVVHLEGERHVASRADNVVADTGASANSYFSSKLYYENKEVLEPFIEPVYNVSQVMGDSVPISEAR